MLLLADPERALAVTYAVASARPALTALFALDERLGGIVATTTEPMIGLMRLAWWREALEKLDASSAPAEPLLRVIAERVLPLGPTGEMLAELEHGWSALLDGEADASAIARFARSRGGRLFTVAGLILRMPDDGLAQGGEAWALADLAHHHSDPVVRAEAAVQARRALADQSRRRWPRAGRALGALVALAKRDVATDAPRRQGSPGRLLRMLALRLTGR